MTHGDPHSRTRARKDGGWVRRIGGGPGGAWSAGVVACAAAGCLLPAAASASVSPGVNFEPATIQAHGLGLIPTQPSRPSAKAVARVRTAAVSLPASADLTAYAMPVGNQGAVGSCAAWSSDYAALGYWENKQGIAGGGLEPMYTYSQVTGGVDNGSTIEGNLQIDVQQGIDNQSDYGQGNFDYRDMPTAAERAHAVNWMLSSYNDLTISPSSTSTVTQQSIETALAAGTPVVVGIPVYSNFFSITSANGGYYSGPSGSLAGYHAIAALGYNASGLVIENSWGTGWGNAGYATLSWAFVNRYVFDAVAVGSLVTGLPVNSTAPAITGTARQGQTLSAWTGSWSPAGGSYAYQWQRAAAGSSTWSAIPGATAATYVPASADVGAVLRVLVTATNGHGQATATSAPLGPISSGAPASTTAPSITGNLRVGQTLTAGVGSWSPAATSYGYQWQRSTNSGTTWSNIVGATHQTYLTTGADANADERVVVTGTNVYGLGSSTSALAGPVSNAPYSTVAPVISGTAARGSTLTVNAGSWSPGGTYSYQWQRSSDGVSWSNVGGATGTSYPLGTADENLELRVVVTAVNVYGRATVTTAHTVPVRRSAPANTSAPRVTGVARVGNRLTATSGSWSGAGNTLTYRWQRYSGGWSNISGATGSTYTLASDSAGTTIRVMVTATNADGSASAASAATARVT